MLNEVDRDRVIDATVMEWRAAGDSRNQTRIYEAAAVWVDAYHEAYDDFMEKAGDINEEDEEEVEDAAFRHAREVANDAVKGAGLD